MTDEMILESFYFSASVILFIGSIDLGRQGIELPLFFLAVSISFMFFCIDEAYE